MFWFFGSLAIGFAAVAFTRFLYRDFAAPVSVFAVVWSVALALFHLNLVDYDPVSAPAWTAILVSGASFCAGGWAAMLGRQPGKEPPPALNRARFERALLILLILGVLGFYLQVRHLQQTVGLETFLDRPELARRLHSNVKVWGYLNILNVANVTLVVLFGCYFRRPRWWMYLVLVPAFAAALLTTDRTRFFYTVVWALFAFWYGTGGLRLTRTKVIGLLLALLMLFGFFLAIGNHYRRLYHDRFPDRINISEEWSFLTEPYVYLTGTLPALSAMMEDENPRYMGKFSFSTIVTLLSAVFPDIEPVNLQGKLYWIPMEVNTFSYLQQFYQDFEWFGLVLGPFLCGFVSCFVYVLMRRRPTLFRIYLAALLTYCCAISIFVNFFTQEATWFFAALGLLISRYVHGGTTAPNPTQGG